MEEEKVRGDKSRDVKTRLGNNGTRQTKYSKDIERLVFKVGYSENYM